MKKLLFFLTIFLPLSLTAQNNWEIPQEKQPTETVKKEKAKKKDKKKDEAAASTQIVGGKVYKIKEEDRPYLKGAVPEEDGKVVFSKDIDTNGMPAKQAFDIVYKGVEGLTKDKNQTEKSRIALFNKEKNSVIATMSEWLVFSDKLLILDRSLFNYLLVADCYDGRVHVTMSRLTYDYGTGKSREFYNAESIITDSKTLKNNGTKLKKTNKKFRKATVDRMNEVFAELDKLFNNKPKLTE
jgi:hypothetical protein